MTTPTSRTFDLGDGLSLTLDEYATAGPDVRTVLVLHGGGGPRTVAGLGAALSGQANVYLPIHPGFEGTPRPTWFDGIDDLALTYLDLLDAGDRRGVVVVGSSIGGWVAAEMALRDTGGRIAGLVLINAVGIQADGVADVVDTRKLSPADLAALAIHNPALRPDPASFTEAQRAAAVANQRTLEVYGGEFFTHDPKLRRRLRRVAVPTLVLWGELDGVAPVEYGRAYAEAFPRGHFVPVPDAGHLPQIEQPGPTLAAIDRFLDIHLSGA